VIVSMSPTSSTVPSADPRSRPDVAHPPRPPQASRLWTAVAERLGRRSLGRLPLRVRLAGGEPIGLGGPLMEVHDPYAFFRRIAADGFLGFGESYMAGEWESRDLVGVLTVLAQHPATLVPEPLQRLRGARHRTSRAAQCHLPHELFALFLDETLSYSCALFRGFPAERHLLPAAHHRKIDRLLDLARVGPGTQLLDIGTGGGEQAIRAARRGARVLSVTLSREQQALARQRVRAAGLEGRVTVLLRDWRKVLGSYDAILSVEPVEAVGDAHWPEYVMTLDRLLAPGGRIALQAVTVPSDLTPIETYVLRGATLPSDEAVEQFVSRCTGLRVAGRDGFGAHYAETLRLWRERFAERAHEAGALGFDHTFRRMWTFHLAHFEAGFRSGCLDVRQVLLVKGELAP
jgi:cyclopropane-fatty-acyl-phospholipid synthase